MNHDRACTVHSLIRGRYPFVTAELFGGAEGRMEFYNTPLGVVVSAQLWDCCGEGRVEMFLGNRPLSMPPLWIREGKASYTVVTGKISPSELMTGRIRLRSCSDNLLAAEGLLRVSGQT